MGHFIRTQKIVLLDKKWCRCLNCGREFVVTYASLDVIVQGLVDLSRVLNTGLVLLNQVILQVSFLKREA